MARNFLIVTMFVFFVACGHFGETTRFLPMVIWDHFNNLLSCKCNWLTITPVNLYDRLTFVCPVLGLTVSLLDGQTRPKSEMNVNLFRRKWPGTMDELKQKFTKGNNDLCDPKKSVKVGTCTDGKSKSLDEKFTQKEGFTENEIYIYFNNAATGTAEALNSEDVICHMMFIVQINNTKEFVPDMSYGKCHQPDKFACKNINETCRSTCKAQDCPAVQPTSPLTVITPQTSSHHIVTESPSSSPSPQTSTSTTSQVEPTPVCPEYKKPVTGNTSACVTVQEQKSSEQHKLDRMSLGVGIVIGIFIGIVVVTIFILAYCKFHCKKSNCWQVKSENGRISTLTTETIIDNKTAKTDTEGFNNKSFEPQTPSPTSSPPEEVMYINGLKTDERQVNTWLDTSSVTRSPSKLLPPLQGPTPNHRKNQQLLPIVRRHHGDLNRLPSIEQSETPYIPAPKTKPKINETPQSTER